MSRDEYSREGIAKTARQLKLSAQRRGETISHEDARRRVVRAVRSDERKAGR